MTLPTGAISMNDVNVELGRSGTTVVSLNDTDVRAIAALPTGAISMNDLRGKSATTYGTLSPNLSTIAEGASVTFTLSGGTGIPNGTYYWRVDYVSNMDSADFSVTSGSFSITSNTGSFTVTTVNDTLYEGNGTFRAVIGVASGVPVVSVTSSLVTVTETVSYTPATPVNTNPYRFGTAILYRSCNCVLNTTQVPDGTTIYWDILNVTGTVTTTDISAVSGSFSITSNSGFASITVNEILDGTAIASKAFQCRFYTDSARTNPVATSATITIRAAPTYSLSFSPTSINEGSTTTGTITTTNLPPSTTLYYTSSGTAGATADFTGFPASGSIAVANNSATFSLTAIYDDLTESAETFTLSLRTVSTAGSVVTTATLTLNQYLGVIGTVAPVKSGGAINTGVTVTVALSGLAAYPLARTMNVWYSIDNKATWTQAGLTTASINVPANATSVAATTVYTKASGNGQYVATMYIQIRAIGHTPKDSTSLTAFYI